MLTRINSLPDWMWSPLTPWLVSVAFWLLFSAAVLWGVVLILRALERRRATPLDDEHFVCNHCGAIDPPFHCDEYPDGTFVATCPACHQSGPEHDMVIHLDACRQ